MQGFRFCHIEPSGCLIRPRSSPADQAGSAEVTRESQVTLGRAVSSTDPLQTYHIFFLEYVFLIDVPYCWKEPSTSQQAAKHQRSRKRAGAALSSLIAACANSSRRFSMLAQWLPRLQVLDWRGGAIVLSFIFARNIQASRGVSMHRIDNWSIMPAFFILAILRCRICDHRRSDVGLLNLEAPVCCQQLKHACRIATRLWDGGEQTIPAVVVTAYAE